MQQRSLAVFVSAILCVSAANAEILDYAKYPNLKGQWNRFIVRRVGGQPSFDQTKPDGVGQEAPLTTESKALLDASLADLEKGGIGSNVPHAQCTAAGMPYMMVAFRPLEFVLSPETTYILIADYDSLRRIFTRRSRVAPVDRTYLSGLLRQERLRCEVREARTSDGLSDLRYASYCAAPARCDTVLLTGK
jgi:hypothetical protein